MPTRVSETLEDGDRYIVWVSSRVGHHSAAAEDCEARTQWHWQMETYAALATIRSCKCGIDVDSLMARRERTHRRNYGPYVSNHFYPARRIRYPCHWSPYRCTQNCHLCLRRHSPGNPRDKKHFDSRSYSFCQRSPIANASPRNQTRYRMTRAKLNKQPG